MHAPEGEKMAKSILRRLKFDNDTISKVSRLIKYHDDRPMPEMRSVRRAVNRIGEDLFPMYLEVQEADMLARVSIAERKNLPTERGGRVLS